MRNRFRTRQSTAGFTIIEMMVVMALIAMMVGATFAMFRSMGRTNTLDSTANEINSIIRRARSTSLARSSTVELGFELYREQGVVRSHLRRPVTHFHFEEASGAEVVLGTSGFRGQISDATTTALGRTGRALQLFGEEGSCVEVPADPRLDCTTGVSMSCDVFVERLDSNTYLIRRASNYFVGIRNGFLFGGGTFKGTVALPPRPGETEIRSVDTAIVVVAIEPVPARRWVHVEFVLDQRGGRLFMDDVQIPSYVEDHESREDAIARSRLAQIPPDPNDPNAAALRMLPETWDSATHMTWIYFGADGRLDPQHHTEPVELYLEMPAEGNLDGTYDLWPSVRTLLEQGGGASQFALQRDGENLRIGAGLFGKLDNVQIAEVQSGDAVALPAGVVLVSRPTNVMTNDSQGNPTPLQVERRKFTVELMGTIR